MIEDARIRAAALYEEGWRSKHRDELIEEYKLTDEEADSLVEELKEIEEEDNMIKDVESMASALYGGGWRSEDMDELIEEYELTEEEAESLVKELKKIEEENA